MVLFARDPRIVLFDGLLAVMGDCQARRTIKEQNWTMGISMAGVRTQSWVERVSRL